MIVFRLPDLGEGLQEAEIVAWHVAEGDHVVADQPLVSVETAKAVVEVPAPWPGRIRKLYGQPGDIVEVGSELAEFETSAIEAVQESTTVVGELPDATLQGVARTAPPAPPTGKASPAVRRLAAERDIDLSTVTGSGPDGAILSDDVEAAVRGATARNGYMPLRGVRRAMADTMTRWASGVVPASVTDEAVLEAWPKDADPTVRLAKAIAAGCSAAPSLNAWYDAERNAVRPHEHVDLGIAMETDSGLFVPVLRNVGGRNEGDLRAGLEVMKRDVADRTVPLSELQGQTISLSNFGMLGGMHAVLTVVPPQVAILGAGRIHRAARVIDGAVACVHVMPLSVTFDHRVVTGAEALRFLNAVIAALTEA
jgi:2-oxoisovalerate dehydrogenase E2 component (dihydrolipoyl transacylase)